MLNIELGLNPNVDDMSYIECLVCSTGYMVDDMGLCVLECGADSYLDDTTDPSNPVCVDLYLTCDGSEVYDCTHCN